MSTQYTRLLLLVLTMTAMSQRVYAATGNPYSHPFYIGLNTGYGATTWSGLVPLKLNPGDAMTLSTPTKVEEGGIIWGVHAGYEVIKYFALEASYIRWPNATIHFDPDSLFAFDHNGRTTLESKTESVSLMAKFLIDIPHTSLRAFSGAGVSGTHRYDELKDTWRATPSFEVGLNYNCTERIMIEVGGDYTAGYAESEIDPSKDFVPFLYSGFLRLSYRI